MNDHDPVPCLPASFRSVAPSYDREFRKYNFQAWAVATVVEHKDAPISQTLRIPDSLLQRPGSLVPMKGILNSGDAKWAENRVPPKAADKEAGQEEHVGDRIPLVYRRRVESAILAAFALFFLTSTVKPLLRVCRNIAGALR